MTVVNERTLAWGNNIKQVREKLGLTQAEFGARLGVTQACVQRWEKGTSVPNDDMKVEIGALFGVDARLLFPLTPTVRQLHKAMQAKAS